ncbi:hypothetical protein [Arthrobacter ramosus]|uniref:ATP-binding protein n=1 Tax=Arthrobacter ramosus TaxID=1672 RepID=A0ABV5XY99_ARTRM|nr:hypothetical protein [Arthrobacter ramosus]
MPEFGPFSVAPEQISGLGGANFGQFVSRLIATEAAAHGMRGTVLETTYLENIGDGGVDAGLRHAAGTSWIPAGDSAWQFKAGDLAPGRCKTELRGAARALEILQGGGQYRLVLGASLTSTKIDKRRNALIETAVELGIAGADKVIDVVTADGLARWAEQYPALAVSPVLRGIGHIGHTVDEWSRSKLHATSWVTSTSRETQIDAIRQVISGNEQLDLHVDGESGLGKTRLVLEALRGQPYEAIVIYAPAADEFPVAVLGHLQAQERSAVVVVDECDRKQHEVYSSVLHAGSAIRLLTIGEPGGNSTRSPMICLGGFDDEAMRELLRKNEPQLWPEAERVVVDVVAGNIDYALKAAKALVSRGAGSAGSLITEEDVRAFMTEQLPDGTLFLACCALALFSRFGCDADAAVELSTIASGLGFQDAELHAALTSLQRHGLLSRQGRFRSVAPHPLAVYLASRGWDQYGQRIISNLLPMLDSDLAERLFRRAAEIGELDSASSALAAMMSETGVLSSFGALGRNNNSRLLVHFAVLAPRPVADRLSSLIEASGEDELREHQSVRRDLVWTLEKLAWHSRTFETAADSLLRLALAETEQFSNNANGTWIELFGTMLPGTAAPPEARIAYLRSVAASDDARMRLLALKGAARALAIHESIMVSGEVQGGVVVERRGRPETWGDAWSYRNAAIDILGMLATDDDGEVASTAIKALIEAIHGSLEMPAVRDHLGQVLATLPRDPISQVRIEIEQLRSMFARVEAAKEVEEDEETDVRRESVEVLASKLPPEDAMERLIITANTNSWDSPVDEVTRDLIVSARAVADDGPGEVLLKLLSSGTVQAAFAAGAALSDLGMDLQRNQKKLAALFEGPNSEAVFGYLHRLADHGDTDAYDRYVDGQGLPPLEKLRLSVRGPRTERAVERVDQLVRAISVSAAARLLFAWMHEAPDDHVARYLALWLDRIDSQEDYNAAVDFAWHQLLNKERRIAQFEPLNRILVAKRSEFPDVGHQYWGWTQLAERWLNDDPIGLASLLTDLIDGGAMNPYSGSEEAQLWHQALKTAGEPAWLDVMNRIEGGSWRFSFGMDIWLASAVDLHVVEAWVGSSVGRARIVASVAPMEGNTLPPVARFLLESFSQDDRVKSALVGQFVTGSWSGNESDRISRQIAQVEGWITDHAVSQKARQWIHGLIASLEAWRVQALEREAEQHW